MTIQTGRDCDDYDGQRKRKQKRKTRQVTLLHVQKSSDNEGFFRRTRIENLRVCIPKSLSPSSCLPLTLESSRSSWGRSKLLSQLAWHTHTPFVEEEMPSSISAAYVAVNLSHWTSLPKFGQTILRSLLFRQKVFSASQDSPCDSTTATFTAFTDSSVLKTCVFLKESLWHLNIELKVSKMWISSPNDVILQFDQNSSQYSWRILHASFAFHQSIFEDVPLFPLSKSSFVTKSFLLNP